VDAFGVRVGVIKVEAGSEERGVEEEVDEILDGLVGGVFVDLALELLDDGVRGVDFHRLLGDHVGGHGGVAEGLVLHDLFHVGGPAEFGGDENAGGGGEAISEDDLLDLVAEDVLHLLGEVFVRGLFFFLALLFLFGFVELDTFLGEADELLAFEVLDLLHDVLVDGVNHEDDFEVTALGFLNEGRGLELLLGVTGDVVDGVLAFLHAGDVVLEGGHLFEGLGGVVAEEFHELGAVGGVFVEAELEVLAELFVELLVVLVVGGDVFEHFEGLLGEVLLDDLQDLVLLEVFTGDVQGEIFGVNDTLDEAEPFGAEVLAVVHDEDTADVELDVVLLLVGLEHVEGGTLGDEEDALEFKLTFNGEVLDGEVVFPIVGDGLVEGAVFLLGAFLGVAGPEGLVLVLDFEFLGDFLDLLLLLLFTLLGFFLVVVGDFLLGGLFDLEFDVVADEFGVLLDEVLDAAFFEVFKLIFLELENDLGTADEAAVANLGDGEGTTGGGFPEVGFVVVVLGVDLDGVGDEVGGVETDTELTNHGDVTTSFDGFHEGLGAGAGDGTEVGDEVGLGHTDAGVDDGDGLGGLVGDDLDVKVFFTLEDFAVGDGHEADLVEGIGGVGDKLTEEDFLVGVEGVDDEGHQLVDFSLE